MGGGTKIVESGTYQELMKSKGIYYALVGRQDGKEGQKKDEFSTTNGPDGGSNDRQTGEEEGEDISTARLSSDAVEIGKESDSGKIISKAEIAAKKKK